MGGKVKTGISGHSAHDIIVESLIGRSARFGAELLSSYGMDLACGPVIQSVREPYVTSCGIRNVPDIMFVVRAGMTLSGIIEVKRTLHDLVSSSEQYDRYLETVSCFFIAVPGPLVHVGLTRIRSPVETMPYKGLVNADNGQIVILPRCRNNGLSREIATLTDFLHKVGHGCGTVLSPMDVPLLAYDIGYSVIDGMTVRDGYRELALREKEAGYPLDEYIRRGMIRVFR